jgi:hypothetical protein
VCTCQSASRTARCLSDNPSGMVLDEKQAYEAMRVFLTAYWERGGRKDDDVAQLLRWTDRESVWEDCEPFDPAMWSDWLEAVRQATAK